jgi:uncharacterized membrane protein
VTAEGILGPMVIGVLFVLGGLVMLVMGIRIRAGKLRRNRWVGMRTTATMRSDEAWNAAQRATLPSLWITGPVLIALGAVDIGIGVVGGHDRLVIALSVAAILVVIAMAVYQMVKGTAAAKVADPD